MAFLGDSITQFGWGQPDGYVRMCEMAFKVNSLDVKIYPKGISGHKSNDMLARVERDIIRNKPTYMTLSCGVNDIIHGARGVELEPYKANIRAIVEKVQAAGIKVIILTATTLGEPVNEGWAKKQVAYNQFLRDLAKEKGCKLVDLGKYMADGIAEQTKKNGKPGRYYTCDGIHMAQPGNRLMAYYTLRDGFGFTEEELAKFDAALPSMNHQINIRVQLPYADYCKMGERAAKDKRHVDAYLTEIAQKAILDAAK